MIKKDTLVVRTKFDGNPRSSKEIEGYMFLTKQEHIERAYYKKGLYSIPKGNFRIATPVEKYYFQLGITNINNINKGFNFQIYF